jgi:catechol 2,3-dioxygenase
MSELGHIVFYVKDIQRSSDFYEKVVGLNRVGSTFGGRAVAFSGGRTHHELLLIEVGQAKGPLSGRRIGLYHTGWKVGDTLNDLRDARQRVEEAGFKISGQSDHGVSQSLYLLDPDGNEVELFVDDAAIDWRNSNDWLQDPVRPLDL